MGCEVRWTAAAKSDVESTLHHIAIVLASPKAASEHLDAFIDAANLLADYPELHAMGSHQSLASRGLRPYLIKNYVMPYSYDGHMVIVHRVFHSRQDYARLV